MTAVRKIEWFTNPSSGTDEMDSKAVASAIEALDMVSRSHQTDAFRILAVRYANILINMRAEDIERAKSGT